MKRRRLGWALAFFGAAATGGATTYTSEVEQWRQKREASLKAEGGWLSLAGLFWLKEGANAVGSAADSPVKLPRGPERIGVIEYHNGKATFRIEAGAPVTVNGKSVREAVLTSDAGGKPDVVKTGDCTFFVIHRGERDAIRLKDNQSETRTHFTGLHWYPVNPEYRVTAKWTPYNPPKQVAIPNILGETEHDQCPGIAEFTLRGQTIRLEPTVEDGSLFFVFKDQTAGKETYPAGRFLHTDMPKDGKVVLDFNEAYNPPCAFTPYATCPLPTKQNRMPIRLEAGELNFGHH
ncbi:MAG: DUF1684 domain-containing protein [Acidobacteriaceae bacterium]|nr:DUF1684 domain-containing protein [Acidobacteriaceae bacterium]